MSDPTRRPAPAERVPPNMTDLPSYTPNHASSKTLTTAPIVAHVTMQHGAQTSPPHTPHTKAQTHPDPPLLPRMIEALEEGPTTIRQMLTSLPYTWREVNNKGSLVTKHTISQCIWGEHTETDGLQSLQQAIFTAYPPTRTIVTQYTPHLTSDINRDSSVWQHTIRNACQDHIFPHPLHNPIAIFNIHHNSHYTTLIADTNHYSYYDPLNFSTPSTAPNIHNTLRQ
jgi:hypothetical protein